MTVIEKNASSHSYQTTTNKSLIESPSKIDIINKVDVGIAVNIFLYFDIEVATFALVSKTWKVVADDKVLWKTIGLRYGIISLKSKTIMARSVFTFDQLEKRFARFCKELPPLSSGRFTCSFPKGKGIFRVETNQGKVDRQEECIFRITKRQKAIYDSQSMSFHLDRETQKLVYSPILERRSPFYLIVFAKTTIRCKLPPFAPYNYHLKFNENIQESIKNARSIKQ